MAQIPPAPLLAASKAIDEISVISATHQPPDKFTHDRLEREAKSSIPFDAALSYATLGALEAISGNEELMDYYHNNSIQLADNSLTHRNYAGSLYHVLRVREAAEQARIAASLAPDDLEAIRKAIFYTAHSGAITMAASLVEAYNKLTPTNAGILNDFIDAASFQKIAGITDDEIMQLVQIACDFLRRRHAYFVDQQVYFDEEDDGLFSLCLNLTMDTENIWKLNRQLFEIMLDQVPDQASRLSVRFGRNHTA